MKGNRRRDQSRNVSEERKRVPGFEKRERRTRRKIYQRSTERKTQTKARRRNQGKDYKRKRNVNPKVYPNKSVQMGYQRPNATLMYYKKPGKVRKGKG